MKVQKDAMLKKKKVKIKIRHVFHENLSLFVL